MFVMGGCKDETNEIDENAEFEINPKLQELVDLFKNEDEIEQGCTLFTRKQKKKTKMMDEKCLRSLIDF